MPSVLWTMAYVGFGSAIGGIARYLCTLVVHRWLGETFPWGTFAVNVLGSLAIGIAAGFALTDERFAASRLSYALVVTGFLGGFTTFSSFSFQTLSLLLDGSIAKATANALASVLVCVACSWVGLRLGQAVNH